MLLALVSCGGCAAQASQLDYPQWRGRDRDGSASGFIRPASWPDVLTRRWRVDVGEGYATPLVVGDTVYVFSRRDGREVITALDAGTGTQRWQSGYPAPHTPSRPAAVHGSGPKATPLFQDGKVITLGINGVVAAFDAERGTVLWRTPSRRRRRSSARRHRRSATVGLSSHIQETTRR
jgi:outer membrane protein assembly factor BamB